MKNAIVQSVWLGVEDHGHLSAFVYLDMDDGTQGFGGLSLGAPDANYCAKFIRGVLNVLDVVDWAKCQGRPCRAIRDERGTIVKLGHFVKDRWLDLITLEVT